MKKINSNIFAVALFITIVGFLMDGDVKEPSMLMRFVEFFMMTGILFAIISVFYHSLMFARKRVLKIKST